MIYSIRHQQANNREACFSLGKAGYFYTRRNSATRQTRGEDIEPATDTGNPVFCNVLRVLMVVACSGIRQSQGIFNVRFSICR